MYFFKRLALFLLFVITGTFAVSFFYEVQVMDNSRLKLEVAVKLATNDALGQFQSLYSKHNDYFTEYSADDYLDYLSSVESQAQAMGLKAGSSDIYEIIGFLRENAYSLNPQAQFSPLQFDWTFLDERGVNRMFELASQQLMDYNLGSKGPQGKDGWELAKLLSASATIDGPKLIDLSSSANSTDFSKIFGTEQRAETLKNINNNDKFDVMYNYVIAYDCVFTIRWQHNTVSPFFQGISFEMPPIVLNKRYIITN